MLETCLSRGHLYLRAVPISSPLPYLPQLCMESAISKRMCSKFKISFSLQSLNINNLKVSTLQARTTTNVTEKRFSGLLNVSGCPESIVWNKCYTKSQHAPQHVIACLIHNKPLIK